MGEANFKIRKNVNILQNPTIETECGLNQGAGRRPINEENSAVPAVVEGWLFWESSAPNFISRSRPWQNAQGYQNEEWIWSMAPINFEVNLIGEIIIPLTLFISKCLIQNKE
jgi:hypothetical protein